MRGKRPVASRLVGGHEIATARLHAVIVDAVFSRPDERQAVEEVIKYQGLPGDHHFYITFKTQAPGVDIPAHLIAKFPDEMTIVLQNRFWDLTVAEDHFSVGLSFGGVPATLRVPFAAVTQFHDPAVAFELTFQANAAEEPQAPHDEAENDAPLAEAEDDGSNVVSIDFTRKK